MGGTPWRQGWSEEEEEEEDGEREGRRREKEEKEEEEAAAGSVVCVRPQQSRARGGWLLLPAASRQGAEGERGRGCPAGPGPCPHGTRTRTPLRRVQRDPSPLFAGGGSREPDERAAAAGSRQTDAHGAGGQEESPRVSGAPAPLLVFLGGHGSGGAPVMGVLAPSAG